MASLTAIKAAAVALFRYSEKNIAWESLSGQTRKAFLSRAKVALEAAEKAQSKVRKKRREISTEQANAGSVR